jgi:hypothetical protein
MLACIAFAIAPQARGRAREQRCCQAREGKYRSRHTLYVFLRITGGGKAPHLYSAIICRAKMSPSLSTLE